jgi:hypothetical protein
MDAIIIRVITGKQEYRCTIHGVVRYCLIEIRNASHMIYDFIRTCSHYEFNPSGPFSCTQKVLYTKKMA